MTDQTSDMHWQTAVVPTEGAGLRLDVVLTKLFPFSRAVLQRLIEEGVVCVNGRVEKKRYVVSEGDCVALSIPPQPASHIVPEPMTFDVIYEDSSLFVINKPAGLVVHPAPGNRSGTFVNGLVACLKDLACCDPVRPGVVHRLDKDTSGVLIAAKTPWALNALSQQFHDRTVYKEYLAVVAGCCQESVRCSGPIGRDPKNRQKMAIVSTGKQAQTDIIPLHSTGEWTFVKAIPHTGRTHQVRVHLAFLGYPILGDAVYGKRSANEQWKVRRQLLHCWSLTVVHPETAKPLTVKAPMPYDMANVVGYQYEGDGTASS